MRIYFLICDKFEELQFYCERFSNNNQPELTDQEIMTIYLYVMQYQEHFKIKQIHRFASEFLMSWFPKLGSYQAFNNRLNWLTGAFNRLVETLLPTYQPEDYLLDQSLLDSMPIITCSGKRSGKVGREITDKGYCSTKGMFYYGMKLHLLRFRRIGKLLHPEQILFIPASKNDVTICKKVYFELYSIVSFGDKIYSDHDFNDQIIKNQNSEMLTPIKEVKGMSDEINRELRPQMICSRPLFPASDSPLRLSLIG